MRLNREAYSGLVLSWIADHLVDWQEQSLSAILTFWGPFALRDQESQGTASRLSLSSRTEAMLCVQRLQRQIYLLCETFDLPLPTSDLPLPPPPPTTSAAALSAVVAIPTAPLPVTPLSPEDAIAATVRIKGFDDDLALLVADD